MRGKLMPLLFATCLRRITPAHAGKTGFAFACALLDEDHPRACGENHCVCTVRQADTGSPPRMRGKPRVIASRKTVLRITPAHAGKTFNSLISYSNLRRITPAHAGKTSGIKSNRPLPWDHPRACGENFAAFLSVEHILGSPPRMRGKRQDART